MMVNHRSGHPYFIGECGGPMEETICPEQGCEERIGGANEQLLSSNRLQIAHELVTDGASDGATSFYRTQVSLGSILWVCLSLTMRRC